jgi:hypothetical protein
MLAIIGSAENIKTDNEKLAQIIGNGKCTVKIFLACLVIGIQANARFYPGSTPNAIRRRVTKVKNQAKALLAGEGLDMKGLKASKGTPARKLITPAKRKTSSSEDSGEAPETPSKKRSSSKTNGISAKGRGVQKAKKGENEDVIKSDKDEGELESAEDLALQIDGGLRDDVV